MKKLSKEELLKVAKLSNLTLTPREIEKFTPQLSKVVDFISELSEVDTAGVEPTLQTTGLINVFRKDEVKKESMLTIQEATENANARHKNYFKIPPILINRSDK